MRLLLDTNILIDYFGRREPFFEHCVKLRIAQAFGDVELWASAKSFTDVFYVLSKLAPSDAIQAAFVESASFLNVAAVDGASIQQAAHLGWTDFEDALVAVTAQNIGADYIITRDERGFSTSRVPAISAQKLIAKMRDELGYVYEDMQIEGLFASRGSGA